MTEHVCDWKWDIVDNDAWFFCSDPYCHRPMGALEIEARINATEILSAEDATILANWLTPVAGQEIHDALRAYANILEAK